MTFILKLLILGCYFKLLSAGGSDCFSVLLFSNLCTLMHESRPSSLLLFAIQCLSFEVSKMQFEAAGAGNLGRHQDEFLLLIFLIDFSTLDEPPSMWIVPYTLFSWAQLK